MTKGPLTGVRIIDLSHALAGPFCTHHLQLMGADVIKVEPPHGDDFRERPGQFAASNAGKRSMTLDLKAEGSREVLHRLVKGGDVLVENYRPGVAPKLGLDWETLKQVNPRLIFASLCGFGQTGPMKDMPAIESSVQAASGLMAAQLSDDDHPRKTPMLLLDPLTGYVGYAAILAALYQREKTGVGQRIDVAMIDAALMISSPGIAAAQFEAPAQPSSGSIVGRPTVGKFQAKDRPIFIAAVLPPWWGRVSDVIGKPQLKDDPRFSTPAARVANADALMDEWNEALASRPAAEWEAALAGAGVPAGVVRTVGEYAAHPHVVQRGMMATIRAPGRDAPVQLMGAGVKFEHDGPAFQGDVPVLGAQTDEVLAEFGYSADEIAGLRQAGVV